MARSRTILVAGAGIGGIAASVALARSGFRPVVLERAPSVQEIGAGIQLTPNATAALNAIGALERVQTRAINAEEVVVGDGRSGRVISRSAIKGMKFPWLLILRADLQRALYEHACDNVDVVFEFDSNIIELATHARGITALAFRHGRIEEHLGIGIVGADGLWSKVRETLHDNEPPVFSGYAAWRTLIPAKKLPAEFSAPHVRIWLTEGAHLVHYPVSGGEQINVVAVFRNDWTAQGWNEPAPLADMPKPPAKWGAAPRMVLEAATEFRRWALADRPPLHSWGKGVATLLGDAAHPMLPFIAQGAGAALEDAEALGRHVKRTGEIEAAFRAYERERERRAAKLQNSARLSGRIYHAGGALRWLRDFKLGWSGDRLIAQKSWIYRYGNST